MLALLALWTIVNVAWTLLLVRWRRKLVRWARVLLLAAAPLTAHEPRQDGS